MLRPCLYRVLALAVFTISMFQAAPVPLGLGQVVILTGSPGSGKTLQANSLNRKYKVPIISVAQLLNAGKSKQKPKAGTIQAALSSGELLSDQAAIDLISVRASQADAGKGFILDGYPNSEAQAKFLDSFVVQHNLQPPIVIVLDVSDDVARERMLKRKRPDDTPANIDRRLKEYHQEETFLDSWYKRERTVRVDATRPAAEVFLEIESGLVELFDKKGFKARSAPAR